MHAAIMTHVAPKLPQIPIEAFIVCLTLLIARTTPRAQKEVSFKKVLLRQRWTKRGIPEETFAVAAAEAFSANRCRLGLAL